ncbi:hypothetical protein F66182_6522 [Fusarium sp. NRRL 66182]|nr:hypothetical protein F66182_6522 [Fusarium sp. NRRL 66182]
MSDDGLSIYDEVEIEDMTFDEAMGVYQFPCPCGDRFQITLEDLLEEQDIAVCPSCSLMIRVIFDLVCFIDFMSSTAAAICGQPNMTILAAPHPDCDTHDKASSWSASEISDKIPSFTELS